MGCINNLSERVKSVSAASEKVYAVEMQGISKYFGSFCALNGVQLSVEKGSIHALLGENGVKRVSEIINATIAPKVRAQHKHYKDAGLGVSPHMLKCTQYDGRLYEMGACTLSIQ